MGSSEEGDEDRSGARTRPAQGVGGEEEDYFRQEIRYGSFQRTVPLPAEVEPSKATAETTNGMLTIEMPKSKDSKSHKVAISAAWSFARAGRGETVENQDASAPKLIEERSRRAKVAGIEAFPERGVDRIEEAVCLGRATPSVPEPRQARRRP